jgi:hypothetical protein
MSEPGLTGLKDEPGFEYSYALEVAVSTTPIDRDRATRCLFF